MSDSKLLGGSICVTDLIDAYQKGHSAFTRSAKNGKVYVNINEWINEDTDEYGNHGSISLSSFKNKDKDMREADEKLMGKKHTYIGNVKWVERKEAEPISNANRNDFTGFGGAQQGGAAGDFTTGFPGGKSDDLPF
jgi:hypothetical protein